VVVDDLRFYHLRDDYLRFYYLRDDDLRDDDLRDDDLLFYHILDYHRLLGRCKVRGKFLKEVYIFHPQGKIHLPATFCFFAIESIVSSNLPR